MVAVVDVEQLVVRLGATGVLGAQHALVQAKVGEAQELLGQVDQPVVEDQLVERGALEGEPGHDGVRIGAEGGIAFGIPIGREVVGAREDRFECRPRRRHHLDGQQSLHHAPAIALPLRLELGARHETHPATGRGLECSAGAGPTPWAGRWPIGSRPGLPGGELMSGWATVGATLPSDHHGGRTLACLGARVGTVGAAPESDRGEDLHVRDHEHGVGGRGPAQEGGGDRFQLGRIAQPVLHRLLGNA